jgi:hypothetical protein
MMATMKTLAMAALVSFAFTPARAMLYNNSGNDLYKFCSSRPGSFESGMCVGLVSAYFESLHIGFVCKAENDSITPKQLIDIVMKFYNDYPNQRHRPAMIGASAALLRAFECEQPAKEKEAN